MKSKLSLVLCFAFIAIIGLNAFATLGSLDIVAKIVDKANAAIEKEIKTADCDADKLYSEYIKDLERYEGNEALIELISATYERTISLIISNLIADTNSIARDTIEIAESYGVTIECVYKTYQIGPVTVEIDPLRIADD